MSGRTGTEPAATAEVEARRLLARGVAAGIDGRLTTAIEDLERALAILGLSPRGRVVGRGDNFPGPPERIVLVARILVSLAFPQHELGRDAIASRALDDAERLLRSWPNDELTVLIHAQRGAILLREGRITEAVAQLDQAVELLDNAAPEDQCKILINRGELHTMLGNIPAARADTERALRLAEKHQIATLAFGATHNLGMQEYFAGRLPSALAQIPPMDAAHTDFERGVVGMDRSKVLLSAGLVSEADQALVDACAALSRTEMVQFLAEAELTRAEVALLADDPQLAQRVSQAAIDRLRPRSNRRAIALGELVKLKADAAAGAPRGAVVRTADRLAGVLAELGLPDHARLARLIAIDCSITARGTTPLDPRRARNDTRERAISPARGTTPLDPRRARNDTRERAISPARGTTPLDPRRQLPAISPTQPLELRLYGRLVRTRLAFARGDRRSGLRQARAGMLDLTNYEAQFGSLDLQTSSAVRGVSLAAAVVAQEIAADRPTSVLTWLERARAISGRVVPLQPPEDDVTAQLLAQLRWVTNQIDDPATSARAADDLRRRRTALESQIRSRSWTVQGQAPMAAEPRVSDLRRALGSAVLVAIFTLHEQLFGIALTARRCWLRPLGALSEVQELSRRVGADLDVLALGSVPEPLRASARGSLRRGLGRLDTLLLAPLRLPDAPVVLLPPGRLASLTWAELPSFQQRPLAIAPSASTWLNAHARFVAVPGRVVAVAGPGLQRAEAEVAAVSAVWPGCRTLAGPEARVERFLAAINGAQLVHVAAHGRHQRQSPLFSSIRLADGPVVGYDLDRVPDPPQQVVLSACDLGQATVRPGDEALGLTRALLHSGSSTVISGVAKVSDAAAEQLMADYHRRLAAGSTPAYALADALAATDDPMPFACFGAGW